MNPIQRILMWIRERLDKMIETFTLKSALKIDVAISPEMTDALGLWSQMYVNKAPWLTNHITSMNLPATIAAELARLATIEMETTVSGSPRADYIHAVMQEVLSKIRVTIEYGTAKGGIMFKPYVSSTGIGVDYVQADQFFPVMYDANQKITGCIFVDQRRIGGYFYTRLESHMLVGTDYIIKNSFFRGTERDSLGQEISPEAIADWAALLPETKIINVKQPLFGYFKFPAANNIDPTSPLGVSCYSRSTDLIKQADIQWSDFLWEFESGRRALYADVEAFEKDPKTKQPMLPFKRLYRTLKGVTNIGDKGKLFEEWTPTLREENLLNGLNAMLRQVELNCGLAFGTLSEPNEVALTATEIKISKQRTYSTVNDIQKALETALNDLIYAVDVWVTLGKLAPKGSYQTVYTFDDSVITDRDAQFAQDTQAVGLQAMSLIEFRMRTYKETEEVARKMLALVESKPTSVFDNV